MEYSEDLNTHLRNGDEDDVIYCPVEKDWVEWGTYTGDEQPASDYCEHCRELLDVGKLDTIHHAEVHTEWFCRGHVVDLVKHVINYNEPPVYRCSECREEMY